MTPELAILLITIAGIIIQQVRVEQKLVNSARELKASEARLVVSNKENAQKIEDNRIENESRNIDLLKESAKNYAEVLARAASAEALVSSLQRAQIADRDLNLRSVADTQKSNEQHAITQGKLDTSNKQLEEYNVQMTDLRNKLAIFMAGGVTPANKAENEKSQAADTKAAEVTPVG